MIEPNLQTTQIGAILQRAFPGIHPAEAQELVACGRQVDYAPGLALTHEDAREDVFYILLAGSVEVTKVINDSENRVLKVLQPGDFFGEMALINNAPRAATVTTLTAVTVLEINREEFHTILQRNSSVSMAMVKEVSRRLRENDQMAIEDLRLKASELASAYQQLAELESARSEFLTVVAHELRTPLTIASGFLQVVRMGAMQGEALNYALDTVTKSIQEIITLVNGILFLQEMDLILLDRVPVDIGAILTAAVEQRRRQATNARVGLQLSIASGLPRLPADARALERALLAILDNAIKFSPDGGEVQVEAGYAAGAVQVRVADHGVGIPPEAMPRIFDRFFHLEEVGYHLFRGIGLGLSIAQEVIKAHQGHIEVQSALGEGTTVTVCLPCQ